MSGVDTEITPRPSWSPPRLSRSTRPPASYKTLRVVGVRDGAVDEDEVLVVKDVSE